MTDCGYIDDGYTMLGRIPSDPGFHPELNFEFRPLLQSELLSIGRRQEALRKRASQDRYVQMETMAADVIAEHVTWWDLVDSRGEPVTISQEAVKRLERHLFGKLYEIILGERRPTPEDDVETFDEQASAKN
jgi:hypothetical protein